MNHQMTEKQIFLLAKQKENVQLVSAELNIAAGELGKTYDEMPDYEAIGTKGINLLELIEHLNDAATQAEDCCNTLTEFFQQYSRENTK